MQELLSSVGTQLDQRRDCDLRLHSVRCDVY